MTVIPVETVPVPIPHKSAGILCNGEDRILRKPVLYIQMIEDEMLSFAYGGKAQE